MATSKDLPEDIGSFIRDLRQTAKISLRQLADKAGVSNPYLSQIERGLRKPSAEVLQQIASALRVSTPAMYLRAGLLEWRRMTPEAEQLERAAGETRTFVGLQGRSSPTFRWLTDLVAQGYVGEVLSAESGRAAPPLVYLDGRYVSP